MSSGSSRKSAAVRAMALAATSIVVEPRSLTAQAANSCWWQVVFPVSQI